jgi:glyoxylase-like metal-dependent hydrolase (beta-lactamase superfamily II)
MKASATKAAFGSCIVCGTAAVAAFLFAPPAKGQSTPYEVINAAAASSEVTTKTLRGGVSVLEGSGGNIGVLRGPGGYLLVDAGISVSRAKIEKALADLGAGAPRYVINTHWHWDHTDGNGWLNSKGATIVASPGIAKRLAQEIRVVEWGHTFRPVEPMARPTLIVRSSRTIRWGGETVLIRSYKAGHTDGDLSVFFRKADVLQTGDTWWNGFYPFIDYVAGGSIDGTIDQANANIAMAGANTLVIPGHGPVGRRRELTEFRDMLVAIRAYIAALKARGMSLEEVRAARPTREFDAKWGTSVINGDLFTQLVFRGV